MNREETMKQDVSLMTESRRAAAAVALRFCSDLVLAEDGGVIHDPLCVGSVTRNHHDPKIPHDHLHLKPEREPLSAPRGLRAPASGHVLDPI